MLSLTEALAALPGTADEIAAHLTALGIRGVPESPHCCPVANYLTGAGFHGVDVNADEVNVDEEPAPGYVETPQGIASFVRRFDAGEWPELVVDDA